jgi:hypothetical protein
MPLCLMRFAKYKHLHERTLTIMLREFLYPGLTHAYQDFLTLWTLILIPHPLNKPKVESENLTR